MGFAPGGVRVWPVPPDWASAVEETLAWGTDSLRSSATGVSHHRGYRLGPSRSFGFATLAWEQEHRVQDMLLAGYRGLWQLPIWPDVQWLDQAHAVAATEVACRTAGFDFVSGGKALLYRAVNAWEVVTIETVGDDHLVLEEGLVAAYGPGCRIYPLRAAILRDGAEVKMRDARTAMRRIAADIVEPCDWPALAAGGEYLGHPVLGVRPDASGEPAHAYGGLREALEFGAGSGAIVDLPGITLREQSDQWKLHGREEHTWFRSLLYTLQGAQRPIWVPSWMADISPAAAVTGGSTTLAVHWCGFTQFAHGRANRRDLRIELDDGTVLLRRVTGAVEAGATEALTLSSELDAGSIAPGRVRQISIMSLCTLASDNVEIKHVTDADGLAESTTGWMGVVPSV